MNQNKGCGNPQRIRKKYIKHNKCSGRRREKKKRRKERKETINQENHILLKTLPIIQVQSLFRT
jgi:hypothetical protein